MGWFAAIVLIALVLFWLWRLAEFRGVRLEWLGAGLLIGLAGYAWQGSPLLGGRPTMALRDIPAEGSTDLEEGMVNVRQGGRAQQWLAMSEALNRRGNHYGAASAIQNALKASPDDADLWVALGNALLLHGGGTMNPAANLAFERAARLDPDHPGPPFFIGLGLAQAGQLDEAERIWTDLLARTPEDAGYRADLEERLIELRMALGQTAAPGATEPVGRDAAS